MNKLGSSGSQMQTNNNSTSLETHANNTLVLKGANAFNTAEERSLAEINDNDSKNHQSAQMQNLGLLVS